MYLKSLKDHGNCAQIPRNLSLSFFLSVLGRDRLT